MKSTIKTLHIYIQEKKLEQMVQVYKESGYILIYSRYIYMWEKENIIKGTPWDDTNLYFFVLYEAVYHSMYRISEHFPIFQNIFLLMFIRIQ